MAGPLALMTLRAFWALAKPKHRIFLVLPRVLTKSKQLSHSWKFEECVASPYSWDYSIMQWVCHLPLIGTTVIFSLGPSSPSRLVLNHLLNKTLFVTGDILWSAAYIRL
jgi:hypothetical protein